MKNLFKALFGSVAATAIAVALVACGGDDAPPAANSATVVGTAVKGPINGATVTIYAVDSAGVKGAAVGSTTTGAGGTYSASVAYAGPVLVEVTGGTYIDEATGTTKTLSETLKVMLTTTAGGTVTGVVTPLTTAAYALGQVGGTAGAVSIGTYGAAVTSIATQFNLAGVNLVTSVPSVTGTLNAYGQMLRAVSQFTASGGSLNAFLNWASPASFQVAFSTAYSTVNGSPISFSFNNNSVVITGTGAGGGSGTCGVGVTGTVTANGMNVPFNLNYCIKGIAAGSCDSGNSSISQGLSGNPAVSGVANLNYTYSASCAAGALDITLN